MQNSKLLLRIWSIFAIKLLLSLGTDERSKAHGVRIRLATMPGLEHDAEHILEPLPNTSNASRNPNSAVIAQLSDLPRSNPRTLLFRQIRIRFRAISAIGTNGLCKDTLRLLRRRATYIFKAFGIFVAIAFGG